MLALPQDLHNCLLPEVTNLLLHLESVSWVAFFHRCYLTGLYCRCLRAALQPGAPSTTPATTTTSAPAWSQFTGLATSGGSVAPLMTTAILGAPTQGAIRVTTPPRLPAPGAGSHWNLPQPGLSAPSPLMPPPQPEFWHFPSWRYCHNPALQLEEEPSWMPNSGP